MSQLKAELFEVFNNDTLNKEDLKDVLIKIVDKLDHLELISQHKMRQDFDKPQLTFTEFVKEIDIDRDLSFKDLNLAIKASIEKWLKDKENKPIIQNGNKIMIYDQYSWRNIKIKDYKLVYNSIARSLSKNSLIVLIPFCIATSATLADGSTPRWRIPISLKFFSMTPSLLPISTTNGSSDLI